MAATEKLLGEVNGRIEVLERQRALSLEYVSNCASRKLKIEAEAVAKYQSEQTDIAADAVQTALRAFEVLETQRMAKHEKMVVSLTNS